MTLARIFAGLLACSLPAMSGAATLTYSNAAGTHFHSGGNVGPAYSPLVSDRQDPIAISPFGLVLGDHTNAYAGPMPRPNAPRAAPLRRVVSPSCAARRRCRLI